MSPFCGHATGFHKFFAAPNMVVFPMHHTTLGKMPPTNNPTARKLTQTGGQNLCGMVLGHKIQGKARKGCMHNH